MHKAVSGCWMYNVLVQKHPLAASGWGNSIHASSCLDNHMLSPLCAKGSRWVLDVHRPGTETPADRQQTLAFVQLVIPQHSSTYIIRCHPFARKAVGGCWTHSVLGQKHLLATHGFKKACGSLF